MFYSVSAERRKEIDRSQRFRNTLRATRNVIASAALILVVLIAGSLAYVLRQTGNVTSPQRSTFSSKSQPITLTPAVRDPRNPVGVALQSLSTPVRIGAPASLSVLTSIGARCATTIGYPATYNGGHTLAEAKTDNYGVAIWNWEISQGTPTGSWPVSITCTYSGKSGVVDTTIQITNS